MKKTKRMISGLLVMLLFLTAFPMTASAAPTNLSFATAKQLTADIGNELTVDWISTGQAQYFYVNATAGQWLASATYSNISTSQYALYIYNNSQVLVAASTNPSINFSGYTIPSTGKYYIVVYASNAATVHSCKFKVCISNGTTGTSSTNSSYNRIAARAYMDEYFDGGNNYSGYNEKYIRFGQDCANYVSQCLGDEAEGGGLPMLGNASTRDLQSSWFHTSTTSGTNGYSATWSGANQFTTHWGTNSMGSGYKRAYECRYYLGKNLLDNFAWLRNNVRVGDVIQLTRNNVTDRNHTFIVSEITTNNILLSAHTSDTITESLLGKVTNNPTMMFVVIRIKQS